MQDCNVLIFLITKKNVYLHHQNLATETFNKYYLVNCRFSMDINIGN